MSFFQSRSSWIERNQISLILPFSLRPSFYVGYLVNVIKEYDSTIGAILGHRFSRALINSEVVNSCESTLITLRKHSSCPGKAGRNFTGVVCIHKEKQSQVDGEVGGNNGQSNQIPRQSKYRCLFSFSLRLFIKFYDENWN